MREILFKAKRLDNGEWVDGYVGYKGKGTEFEECHIMQSTFSETASPFVYPFYFTDVQVDPETVCQYTGLKDKNGVKIFEWDIIDIPGTKRPSIPAPVAYLKAHCQFVVMRNGYNPVWLCDYDCEKSFEVIGNIYDKEG